MAEGTSSPLKIHWVVHGITGSEAIGYQSDLATNRYRAIIPARGLTERGHQVTLLPAHAWEWDGVDRPDLLVLGKLLASESPASFQKLSAKVLEETRKARSQGIPVISDFNDDHFDHRVMGPHWRAAASLASLCTAASPRMADTVRAHTGSPVVVVDDPIASPAADARVFRRASGLGRMLRRVVSGFGSQRLRLIWFGHSGNWPAMERWARELGSFGREQPLLLWLVTKPSGGLRRWVDDFNQRNAPAALAECVDWSEDTQWQYVLDAHVALLPSEPADPRQAVKSSNRLADALNAGCYVVASPLPSYQPYGNFCSLTKEPLEPLRWLIRNPSAALGKVMAGQEAIRSKLSVDQIAKTWEELATRASNLSLKSTAYIQSEKLSRIQENERNDASLKSDLLALHTNKIGKASDKWEWYFYIYERLFAPIQLSSINLLEIGVQNGGSLEVWAQYFPNAEKIIGCDIDPRCAELNYEDSRIEIFIGDATARNTFEFVSKSCSKFDVIIDDGSHLSADIIQTFLNYFPLVRSGGLYVIEDTHAIYRHSQGELATNELNALDFFKQCTEIINLEHLKNDASRERILANFISNYQCPTDWISQSFIESIEFTNSMVIVRRGHHASLLGKRLIAGTEALIHSGVLRHKTSTQRNSSRLNDIEIQTKILSSPVNRSDENNPIEAIDPSIVRLNLGCGDKILKGYINVDVAASRSGKQPDILCDLHDLSRFPSNYADEILAVHVVEHFWRWEIEEVLQGWKRVLKSGGRIDLECPNLISACQEFLKDPDTLSSPSRTGQRTMWVLYGDPAWRDPLMVHRWAYTPKSLIDLLSSIGFIDVQQERAQFKLKEPRDMRISARKP